MPVNAIQDSNSTKIQDSAIWIAMGIMLSVREASQLPVSVNFPFNGIL